MTDRSATATSPVGEEKIAYGRELRTPLTLAVLLTAALALTLRFFQPDLGTEAGWLARFYLNPFYQIISLVFVAALFYGLLQWIGVEMDRRILRSSIQRDGLYRLLTFVSGRPSRGDEGLGAAITHWRQMVEELSDHPQRQRVLDGLGEHILVLREHQRRQNLTPIQFTIWMLPLLGFIGTVVGITRSIVGLEGVVAASGGQAGEGLQEVLRGLQFAFDTTFLGLVLVIPTMALSLWLREHIQRLDLEYQRVLLDGFLNHLIGPAVAHHQN